MAVTIADIKASFPALATAPDELVQIKLDEATLRVNVDAWGNRADMGVHYLTAHLVTLDPAGVKARKVNSTGESVYLAEYNRLLRAVASGFRVTGSVRGVVVE